MRALEEGRRKKPAPDSGAESNPEAQETPPSFTLSWAPVCQPEASCQPCRLTSPPQQLSQPTADGSGASPKASHWPGLSPNTKTFRWAESACRGVQMRKRDCHTWKRKTGPGQMQLTSTDVLCPSSQTGGLALHTSSAFCSYLLQKNTDLPVELYPKCGFRSSPISLRWE